MVPAAVDGRVGLAFAQLAAKVEIGARLAAAVQLPRARLLPALRRLLPAGNRRASYVAASIQIAYPYLNIFLHKRKIQLILFI